MKRLASPRVPAGPRERRHRGTFSFLFGSTRPFPPPSPRTGRNLCPPGASSMIMLARSLLFLSVFMVLLPFYGCSSLPDVQGLARDFGHSGNSPGFIGAEGALSPEGKEKAISTLQEMEGSPDAVEKNLGIVEIVGGTPAFCGNRATLLIDGNATYAAMLNAIANAKDHINLEIYVIEDDDHRTLVRGHALEEAGPGSHGEPGL